MASQRPLVLITKQLDELNDKIGKIFTGFSYNPMPGSIAAIELASAETAETALSAYSQGTILIEIGADQLYAFIRAITEPVLALAFWTNIRSVLEVASIGMWLLDEHINIHERISRSYAFRCSGLDQRIKFMRATKNPVEMEKAEKRRDEVLLKAKELGIAKYNKNGKIILANSMPTITNLVRDQLGEEEAYRLLSAMTHAHNWALLGLVFTPTADTTNGKLLRKALRIESIGYLAFIALKAFQKPIICKCRLFGWPTEDIQTAFDNTEKTLATIFHDLTQ